MARIALKNLFDTTSQGKPNGGVHIYVPELTSETISGKTVYTYTGNHKKAKRIMYQAKTLYNDTWGKNIVVNYHNSDTFTYYIGSLANNGNGVDWSQAILKLTGNTAINEIIPNAGATFNKQLKSGEDIYALIRVIDINNDNSASLNHNDNVSIRISGVNANLLEIRGLLLMNASLLPLVNEYLVYGEINSHNSPNYSYNQWLDELFMPEKWVGFQNALGDAGSSITGWGDMDEFITIDSGTNGWAPTGNDNEWVFDAENRNNTINGCYLLNLRMPKNTTANINDIEVQFVLSDNAMNYHTEPTSTGMFSISGNNKDGFERDAIEEFNEKVEDLTLTSNSKNYIISPKTGLSDKVQVDAGDYPLYRIKDYIVTGVSMYYYDTNGSPLGEGYDQRYGEWFCTFDMSGLCAYHQSSFYLSGIDIWKTDEILTSETSSQFVTGIPAVLVLSVAFNTTFDGETIPLGTKNIYVYRDINDLNTNFIDPKTYSVISTDFCLNSYPDDNSPWVYSIIAGTEGATLKVNGTTVIANTELNQPYNGSTSLENIGYEMSKSGYITNTGTLSRANNYVLVTLSPITDTYQFLFINGCDDYITIRNVRVSGQSVYDTDVVLDGSGKTSANKTLTSNNTTGNVRIQAETESWNGEVKVYLTINNTTAKYSAYTITDGILDITNLIVPFTVDTPTIQIKFVANNQYTLEVEDVWNEINCDFNGRSFNLTGETTTYLTTATTLSYTLYRQGYSPITGSRNIADGGLITISSASWTAQEPIKWCQWNASTLTEIQPMGTSELEIHGMAGAVIIFKVDTNDTVDFMYMDYADEDSWSINMCNSAGEPIPSGGGYTEFPRGTSYVRVFIEYDGTYVLKAGSGDSIKDIATIYLEEE